jgi:hypothetical protein
MRLLVRRLPFHEASRTIGASLNRRIARRMDRSSNPLDQRNRRSDGEDPRVRLRQALAAVAKGCGSDGELECAARALVAQLKHEELPPEQMLLCIKGFLGDSGLKPSYASGADGPIGRDATAYRDVISWCIKAYYEVDSDGQR